MDSSLKHKRISMAETAQRVLEELFEAGELPSEKYYPAMRRGAFTKCQTFSMVSGSLCCPCP
jgi:hypothetical protein